MSGKDLLARLCTALSSVSGVGRGRRYPKRLQKRVVEYYRLRSSQGLSDKEIAAELGILWKTLQRWQKQTAQAPNSTHAPVFEPVHIVDPPVDAATTTRNTLVVRGPAGLCIEGLDLDGLAELVRRLS